mmetsp:Transcript_2324/g.6768  ORF Transcript_2324/g.6768 Transcript_2324/m.6768 type:complete len:365 (+) Transcript_2324:124-1218(+)
MNGEAQTNATLPDYEEPIVEFRNQCRKFYRRSTSVVQSSESLPGLLDEDVRSGTSIPASNDDQNDNKRSRVVVEAIERLVEQSHNDYNDAHPTSQSQSYASFLKAQSAENLGILATCGLPTTEDDARQVQGEELEQLISIRTEERKQAHEVKMVERYHMLQDILVEMSPLNDEKADDSPTFVTTRNDLRRIRRTIREFVRKYHESAIASHPFLAGIRKALRMQVGVNAEVPVECTVVWTLDSAVLTEAIQTKKCGAGGDDASMRDAIGMLLLFMVWKRRDANETPKHDEQTLTFEVSPILSDRSLDKLLEVLPKEKDLHGRPTGNFDVGNTKRRNIEGEQDEIDFCAQIFREAFGGLKLGGKRR